MLELNLSFDALPEKWISKENILSYLCDIEDINIIKEYIKENPQTLENIMNDDCECLTNSSSQVLEYLYELLDKYTTPLILSKFIDSTYNSHADKLKIHVEHKKVNLHDE